MKPNFIENAIDTLLAKISAKLGNFLVSVLMLLGGFCMLYPNARKASPFRAGM